MDDDLRKLKDEARDAAARGKHRKAGELFSRIAARDRDPSWAHRAGEAYMRAGANAEALRRLTYAAAAYGKQGALLKAIAVCTMILELDPDHVATQDILAELYAKRDAPSGRPQSVPPPPLAPAAERGRTFPPPPLVPTVRPNQVIALAPTPVTMPGRSNLPPRVEIVHEESIDDVPLSRAMPHAHPSSRFPAARIPLEDDPPPPVEPADALPRTLLFSSLNEARLRRLIGRVTRVDAGRGGVIVRQGDSAQALYVVARGAVEVTVELDGKQYSLGELGEGQFFGELGVMTNSVRMATVTATTDTELLSIDRAAIVELFREDAEVRGTLLRFFRDRLLGRLLATSPLFTPFSGQEARELMARFQLLEFEAGTPLITQGEDAPALFILLCGRCQITARKGAEEVLVGTSGPSDVCGEMSLIQRCAATATVRAETRVWALAMPRASVIDVVLGNPEVLVRLKEIADNRKLQLGAVLSS